MLRGRDFPNVNYRHGLTHFYVSKYRPLIADPAQSLVVTSYVIRSIAAACLLLVTATSVASAQMLPGPNPGDGPVQQQMLAAEAAAVAAFLDISPEQFQAELVGHSLVQVAEQHGKSANDVTAVVVGAAQQELDNAVSNGQLASDKAEQYKGQIAFLAPFLVRSPQASAAALQAAGQ